MRSKIAAASIALFLAMSVAWAADVTYTDPHTGVPKKQKDMGDGTYSETVYDLSGGGGGGGSGDASAANQVITNTKLDTIDTDLGTLNAKDFATQTTLAALLAKVIAAPATEAKQDTIIARLPAALGTGGGLKVDGSGTALPVSVPTDPFGVNADAGSATGSISAKLRFIASTGIPVTGTVTVGSHAVTNAGTFAVQDGTIAAAIKNEDVASAGADPGVVINGRRVDSPAANAGVTADGDYTSFAFDNLGAVWIAGAQKEDVASADADRGVAIMGVRKATPANTSGTDGDYESLQLSAGRLWTSSTIDAALPAGENHLGEVGGKTAYIDVTLSTDTSAYASGDLLADTQAVASAVRVNDGTGMLQSVTAIDEDDQGVAMTLYFLNANNSFGTENSAPSITDANSRAIMCVVDIAAADWKDLGGVRVANKTGLACPIKGASGSTSIYVAGVNGTGTPTFTASGQKIRIGILDD